MKKLTITIAALLIAGLAMGSLAIGADRATKEIGSTLSVKYKEAKKSDPYSTTAFKGKVGPKKCAKRRKVSVSHYGSTKTNSQGKFRLALGGPAARGKYKVKVAPKEIGNVSCTKVKVTLRIR